MNDDHNIQKSIIKPPAGPKLPGRCSRFGSAAYLENIMRVHGGFFTKQRPNRDYYTDELKPLQSVSSEHLEAGIKCHKCGASAKWYRGQAYAHRVFYCGSRNCESK